MPFIAWCAKKMAATTPQPKYTGNWLPPKGKHQDAIGAWDGGDPTP